MLVKMLEGKDLYYPGELIALNEETARDWIARGLAKPALCPECGSQLEDAGCRVYCSDCGYKHNKE
ncbi:hypothetical protein SEF58_13140 [Neomoorella humiferrea]|uniref:hypothetical protein n=1 Tax=Neomoorella humiferrea TaxID=676965 RepID=UPI003D8B59E0